MAGYSLVCDHSIPLGFQLWRSPNTQPEKPEEIVRNCNNCTFYQFDAEQMNPTLKSRTPPHICYARHTPLYILDITKEDCKYHHTMKSTQRNLLDSVV